ncbi:MAG: ABC transporter permease [Oscillospiraceae bacterium]|nr:ABC transporter permease [Oscillospiraceae bacterium]
MKIKHRYTRFGFSGFLLMLGLFVSAFILIYIADIIIIELKQKNVLTQFENQNYYWIDKQENIDDDMTKEILEQIIITSQSTNCNVCFDNTVNDISNQLEQFEIELIINMNEYPEMITQTGEKISFPLESTQNPIILGKSMLKYCEDNILMVNEIPTEVSYVLNDEYSSGIDYSMYMFWNNCNDDMKEKLLENMVERMQSKFLRIKLYSNSSIDDDYQLILDSLKDYPVVLEKEENIKQENYHLDATNKLLNMIFLPVCILFSLYTCFCISFLWLSQRKKEISIRKAYGFSNLQIFKMLIVDILFLSIPSVIIAVISNIVFRFIINDRMIFDSLSLAKFAMICVGMISEVILCAFYLFQRLNKLILTEEIKS